MKRGLEIRWMLGVVIPGLLLACAGGPHPAAAADVRDAWRWESSAGCGMAWASPDDDRMHLATEVRCGHRAAEHVSLGLSVGITYLGTPWLAMVCVEDCTPPVVEATTVVPVMGVAKVHLPTGRNVEPYVAAGGGIAWYHARSRWPRASNLDEFYPQLCAMAGITGRRRISPRMELRYDCHRGLDPGWYYTAEDHWYQQVTLTIGVNVRAGIHE